MNHLVYLDTRANELEKILSGIKSMLIKEYDPTQSTAQTVTPGDSLYFLRNSDECDLQVKATVVDVLFVTKNSDDDLTHTLKELQPRLQLTEDQYNYWSEKKQVHLVEFGSAHKIEMIQVRLNNIAKGGDWIAFEEFSYIT